MYVDQFGISGTGSGDLAEGAYISTARIVTLTIISLGVYWMYWMYRTWKQFRDHTAGSPDQAGQTHYPVLHGLTQLVPVYGFFRYHDHIREYKALMQARGVPDSLNLWALTTIVVINMIVALFGNTIRDFSLAGSDSLFATGSILGIISLTVTIIVLCRMQSNLNAYWASVDSSLMQPARFGKGEILCIILGVLFWLGIAAGFVWPS